MNPFHGSNMQFPSLGAQSSSSASGASAALGVSQYPNLNFQYPLAVPPNFSFESAQLQPAPFMIRMNPQPSPPVQDDFSTTTASGPIEIFGKVTDILERPPYNNRFNPEADSMPEGSGRNRLIFRIYSAEDNHHYMCKYFGAYLSLEINDVIFCIGEKDPKPYLPRMAKFIPGERSIIIKAYPLVELPSNEESIIDNIVRFFAEKKKSRAAKFGLAKANQLITHIRLHAKKNFEMRKEIEVQTSGQVDVPSTSENGNPPSVSDFLNRLAANFVKDGCIENVYIEYPAYMEVIETKMFARLLKWWDISRLKRNLYLFGLNDSEIKACHMEYSEILHLCRTNPFRLLPVSVDKCIRMLENQLKTPDPNDIRCGHIVRRLAWYTDNKQWCCVPLDNVMKEFPDFDSLLDKLISEYRLVYEFGSIYLPLNRIVEDGIAQRLVDLYRTPMNVIELSINGRELKKLKQSGKIFLTKTNLEEDRQTAPQENGVLQYRNENSKLTEEQRQAVVGLLSNNVSCLDARAGCGKTTIIAELVANLNRLDVPYIICGFTGKSVARVSKEKGINSAFCSTFHRAIGKARQFYDHFQSEEKNSVDNTGKQKFRYLICEESSMLSSLLFWKFIRTFRHKYRIVFVGDKNQLPPMEFGCIFREVIKSQIFPVFSLTQNHRIIAYSNSNSVNTDGILLNANLMIDNPPNWRFIVKDNFAFIPGDPYTVLNIINSAYHQGINVRDISVICPYKNDPSVELLNIKIQEIYCQGKKFIQDSRGNKWFIGDKLMFTNNNYDKDVFNGDDCRVVDIDEKNGGSIKVELFRDQRIVEVPLEPKAKVFSFGSAERDYFEEDPTDTKEEKEPFCVKFLILAYILSCHKSQGSETSYVVVYMPERPGSGGGGDFINKNLLYTSITRARKQLWVVGDINSFIRGAYTEAPVRHENLSGRIQGLYFGAQAR